MGTDYGGNMKPAIFRSLIPFMAGILLSSAYFVYRIPGNMLQAQNTNVVKETVVDENSAITSVVQKSLPSVVTVGIETVVQSDTPSDFNPFFQTYPDPSSRQEVKQNIGSGFIASPDGLVITSKHVVSDTSAKFTVITNDNNKFPVMNIYRDPLNDLAILKINPSAGGQQLPTLPLGDSSHLKLGQLAIAIGTPLGEFQNTVTSGIISGIGRGITAGSPFLDSVERLDNVIQTDAPISPGNSGGPLLDSQGKVIGINAAIAQEGQNLGFAIPVNAVKTLLANFHGNSQAFVQPFLGVRYTMISRDQAAADNFPAGAYINDVIAGSPADKAGIHKNDIITTVDSRTLGGSDGRDLASEIGSRRPGEKVTLDMNRKGKAIRLSVTLGSS